MRGRHRACMRSPLAAAIAQPVPASHPAPPAAGSARKDGEHCSLRGRAAALRAQQQEQEQRAPGPGPGARGGPAAGGSGSDLRLPQQQRQRPHPRLPAAHHAP